MLHIAPVGWVLVGLSMVELLATFGVRFYATKFSEVKLSVQKLITLHYLMNNIRVIKGNQIIWFSIWGTAIFWGMSQNLVAVIPALAKVNLGVTSPLMVNAMLALSVIGIMVGAYASARKSVNSVKVNNIYTGSTTITVLRDFGAYCIDLKLHTKLHSFNHSISLNLGVWRWCRYDAGSTERSHSSPLS